MTMRDKHHVGQILVGATLILAASSAAFAAPKGQNVSGILRFKGKAPIHLYLVDARTFRVPFTGVWRVVLRPTAKQIARGRLVFRIKKVPPGRYGVRCFQDENGNRTLDRGLFGPKEPWGMSFRGKRPFGRPTFDEIAFDVKPGIDRTDLHIVVR